MDLLQNYSTECHRKKLIPYKQAWPRCSQPWITPELRHLINKENLKEVEENRKVMTFKTMSMYADKKPKDTYTELSRTTLTAYNPVTPLSILQNASISGPTSSIRSHPLLESPCSKSVAAYLQIRRQKQKHKMSSFSQP